MAARNPKVDEWIINEKQWQTEFVKMREIVLDFEELTEEVKWGVPCYTFQKKNVILIHGFKEYCGMLFVKGSLLKNSHGILIQQTENVQAARQARFTKVDDIVAIEEILEETIAEAIAIEKAGLKIEFKETSAYQLPEELQAKFEAEPDFKAAFEALTPGRQRAYIFHFSEAKQSKTREARIEKYYDSIMRGKGLND